jgi:hypothetical protein
VSGSVKVSVTTNTAERLRQIILKVTLIRLLKASGATTATMEEIKRDISRWGRGSVYIQVNETGRLLAHLAAVVTRLYSIGG